MNSNEIQGKKWKIPCSVAIKPQWTVRRTFASLPSYEEMGMPALSPTMEKGNIAKWSKKEGEKISPREVIAEIETDKATIDFEATDEGYLAKILKPEGSKDIPVGQTIGIIVTNAADIAAFKDFQLGAEQPSTPQKENTTSQKPTQTTTPSSTPAAATSKKPTQTTTQSAAPAATSKSSGPAILGAPPVSTNTIPKSGVFASPAAKVTAQNMNIDIASIQGSGPSGRIIKADVVESQSAKGQVTASVTSGETYTDIPNSNIRKVIAQRLTLSKQTIPHYYLTMEVNVDVLTSLRARLNEAANGKYKLSVNDFVVKAAALACKKVPEANSSWNDQFIRRYNNVDINVAVNTDRGLLTPIIKDCDKIGLVSINNAVKDLAEKGKANKLSPAEMATGTFTISNLGMFGVNHFAAVINPPQACILAVGSTEKKIVIDDKAANKDQPFKVGNVMTVTMSCDHRVVDGAIGAQWLQSFKEFMEDPIKMLL